MITNSRIKEITLSLLQQKSERDEQKLIGASDFSDPCTYHLAKKLLRTPENPQKYWLGAKIGTGVHTLLEDAITKADLDLLPELKSAVVEQKIYLGELEGYGTISSKPDLVMIDDKHIVDWKTSTRDKSRKMQRVLFEDAKLSDVQYTLEKYYNQTHAYAWGENNAGIEIDGCSIVFVNRDGTTENDIWTWTFDYKPEYAQMIWDRLVAVWQGLVENPDPEQYDRHPECFKCKVTDPA
jgi:hypothetical protein